MADSRKASSKRTTGETDISLELNLDGTGCAAIATGHPFFDHMLHLFARHSLIDMALTVYHSMGTFQDIHMDPYQPLE